MTQLMFAGCWCFDDQCLQVLAAGTPFLIYLDVSACNNVSEYGMHHFAQSLYNHPDRDKNLKLEVYWLKPPPIPWNSQTRTFPPCLPLPEGCPFTFDSGTEHPPGRHWANRNTYGGRIFTAPIDKDSDQDSTASEDSDWEFMFTRSDESDPEAPAALLGLGIRNDEEGLF